MKRLTERFSNGQVGVLGCGSNCKYEYKYCNNHLEDCPTITEIYEKLARYEDTGIEPENIKNTYTLDIGQIVYIVTRYAKWKPYEVIECKVHKQTIKNRCNFSVSGRYENGCHYNGTFINDSIGKKVFRTKEDAEEKCNKLNAKR